MLNLSKFRESTVLLNYQCDLLNYVGSYIKLDQLKW